MALQKRAQHEVELRAPFSLLPADAPAVKLINDESLRPAMEKGIRIQQVSRIPIDKLTPGAYELRVRVHDGGRLIERSAFVRLVE